MLIDIVFIVLLAIAVFKGYTRGLIVAVFSVLALIIGLAAAMKLSVITAAHLKDAVHIAAKWLPVLAFALVFLTVVLVVRLGAAALEKITAFAFLGWANKLGGVLLYAILYTTILSVLLFYAQKLSLLTQHTVALSVSYPFIEPWGPKAIDGMGKLLPFFKDMFQQLETFFARLSDNVRAGG